MFWFDLPMNLIENQKQEVLSTETLKFLINEGSSVSVVSSDGVIFQVSKFMMRFLSYFYENDHDMVITSMRSNHLNLIVDLLNLNENVCQEKGSSNFTQFLVQEGQENLGIGKETMEILLQIYGTKPQFTEDRSLHQSFQLIEDENINRQNSKEVIDFQISIGTEESKTEDKNIQKIVKISNETYAVLENKDKNEVKDHLIDGSDANDDNVADDYDKVDEDVDDVDNFDDADDIEDVDKDYFISKTKREARNGWYSFGNPIVELELELKGIGHRRAKRITCRFCGTIFDQGNSRKITSNYRNHYYAKHEVTKCDCVKKGTSLNEIRKHYEMEHKGFFGCTYGKCTETRQTREGIKKHMKSHNCQFCPFTTTRFRRIKNHEASKHKGKIFENMNENKMMNCCGKEFNKLNFSIHKSRAHNPKTCSICGKVVNNLPVHMRIHTSDAERELKCNVCAKGFYFKSKLKEHVLVEHQGQRYSCRYPDCKNNSPEYRDKSNRDAHERKKHGFPYTKLLKLQEGRIEKS